MKNIKPDEIFAMRKSKFLHKYGKEIGHTSTFNLLTEIENIRTVGEIMLKGKEHLLKYRLFGRKKALDFEEDFKKFGIQIPEKTQHSLLAILEGKNTKERQSELKEIFKDNTDFLSVNNVVSGQFRV